MPIQLPPPPPTNSTVDRWLNLLWRKLSADGEISWDTLNFSGSNITDIETREHNSLQNIQGGVSTEIFEATAFEPTAFEVAVTSSAYHVTGEMLDELTRQQNAITVSANTTMTTDYYLYIADTSAITLTMPQATVATIGQDWTVIQSVNGYVDVAAEAGDEILLRGGNQTIRLRQIGSTLTLRCISATQWVIV